MKLFTTVSRMTVIASLVALPLSAVAQDTSEDTTAAGEELLLEGEQAAEKAVEETGEAVEETAENVAEETGEAVEETAEAAGTSAGAELSEETVAEAPEEGTPPEGTITMQGENTILADDLIGAQVYSGNTEEPETISEIDDLIISLDGTVEGVVIGVGGFLGLGEKDVAIEMSRFEVRTGENGEPRLFLNAARADLEAADTFLTRAEQIAAEEAAQAQAEAQAANAEAEAQLENVESTSSTGAEEMPAEGEEEQTTAN